MTVSLYQAVWLAEWDTGYTERTTTVSYINHFSMMAEWKSYPPKQTPILFLTAWMHFTLPNDFDTLSLSVFCCQIDVALVLLSPSSRVPQPVLSVTEWTWTGHRTVGVSLMLRRKPEESSLRSTLMKSPVSPLRWVAVIMEEVAVISCHCIVSVRLSRY